jgi:hypothetical protein
MLYSYYMFLLWVVGSLLTETFYSDNFIFTKTDHLTDLSQTCINIHFWYIYKYHELWSFQGSDNFDCGFVVYGTV